MFVSAFGGLVGAVWGFAGGGGLAGAARLEHIWPILALTLCVQAA